MLARVSSRFVPSYTFEHLKRRFFVCKGDLKINGDLKISVYTVYEIKCS